MYSGNSQSPPIPHGSYPTTAASECTPVAGGAESALRWSFIRRKAASFTFNPRHRSNPVVQTTVVASLQFSGADSRKSCRTAQLTLTAPQEGYHFPLVKRGTVAKDNERHILYGAYAECRCIVISRKTTKQTKRNRRLNANTRCIMYRRCISCKRNMVSLIRLLGNVVKNDTKLQ
ncbi:hypothetical protein HAX54_012171 [Datura stramonium]|uniref:Uncharacterized protein n=1 Tax=Datura stramonium TaxID=4076 RepID=A0ABS8TL52_DATST|nr:hypothetical protein [Datura stramonium]